jgi:glycosyltransferase involved in cell wall biosynthesis
VRQYVEPLRDRGISIIENPALLSSFPPAQKLLRPFWAIGSLLHRVPGIVRSYEADLSLIQREMLSTLVTLESALRRPRVLDVDDAIWIHMGDSRARRLARLVDGVICGNRHIADYFAQWNENVRVIPTAVDDRRFHPVGDGRKEKVIVGWTGASGAFGELSRIETAIAGVLNRHPDVVFRVVADQEPRFHSLPQAQCEFVRWSPEGEVASIQPMDIGIMPLADTPWNRGKCAYKMLLYMSCGIPVIASPVGMNNDVLAMADCGHVAAGLSDWVDSIELLIADPDRRRILGQNGRMLVSQKFSVDAITPLLADELHGFVSSRKSQSVQYWPTNCD